ncbi:ATP-binding cassette domain-containing protein [Pseudomonadota bacterium]
MLVKVPKLGSQSLPSRSYLTELLKPMANAASNTDPYRISFMIVLEDIYKIFGTRTTQALTLAKEGVDKSEIHTTTGQNIGLANINLSFNLGKTFVIMGLSGSGKSTLLRLLNRLITPSSGRININGTDILSLSERQLRAFRRKHFGMVFHSTGKLLWVVTCISLESYSF